MSKSSRSITLLLATGLSLGCLLFLTVSSVFAHASVIDSTPKAGSTIAKLPTTIQVTTAENMTINPSETNLFVYDPQGKLISQGNAKVDFNHPTQMSIGLNPTTNNGVYVVRWITKSADDGDPDAGAFYFTVNANNTNTATTTIVRPTTTNATTTSSPILPIVLAAIIALLVGLGAGFGIGRTHPNPTVQTSAATETTQIHKETNPIQKP